MYYIMFLLNIHNYNYRAINVIENISTLLFLVLLINFDICACIYGLLLITASELIYRIMKDNCERNREVNDSDI